MFLMSDIDISKLLANRIKSERIVQGLKQVELAKRADIGLAIVRNFEQNGKITLVNLITILKALGKASLFEDLFDFKKERIELDIVDFIDNKNKIYNKKRVR